MQKPFSHHINKRKECYSLKLNKLNKYYFNIKEKLGIKKKKIGKNIFHPLRLIPLILLLNKEIKIIDPYF